MECIPQKYDICPDSFLYQSFVNLAIDICVCTNLFKSLVKKFIIVIH